MLMVQAHRRSKALPFFLLDSYFFSILVFVTIVPYASGQTLLNGQLFTDGLSIVDAPAPQSIYHAGGDLNLAIDVSGDGQLPIEASAPANSGPTGYDGLDIYLVSAQTNTNMTVSNHSDILKQEPGSTVKHLNWPIPSCISAGQYNLTLYECARINGTFYYTITPVPVQIDNSNSSGPCLGVNPLEDQPQASSPPSQSPFLPPDDNRSSASTSSGFVTSVYPSSTGTSFTSPQLSSANPYQSTSSLNGQTVTITASATPTTVTTVMTLTSTERGQTSIFTTTLTSTTTATAIVNRPSGTSGTSGFLPVNTGFSDHRISFSWLLGFLIIIIIIIGNC